MEGPESVGVEPVAGTRKFVVRESVVIEELVNGNLKRVIMVVNIVFGVLEEKAEGIGDVLIHLIHATIQSLMNVQVVTKGTIYNTGVGNQRKTHLKRVL